MKYLTRKEELILLTVSRLNENASLVAIREHLNQHTKRKWSVGNVYVPLEKMSRNGYLRELTGEPTSKRGGKAVKFYRLTSYGLKALSETKKVHDVMWEGFSGTEGIA